MVKISNYVLRDLSLVPRGTSDSEIGKLFSRDIKSTWNGERRHSNSLQTYPSELPTDLELHRVPAKALLGSVPVVLTGSSRLVAGKHPVKSSLTS